MELVKKLALIPLALVGLFAMLLVMTLAVGFGLFMLPMVAMFWVITFNVKKD